MDATTVTPPLPSAAELDALRGAIGYVTPAARMAGLDRAIFAERDRKLEAAREKRRIVREAARQAVCGAGH